LSVNGSSPDVLLQVEGYRCAVLRVAAGSREADGVASLGLREEAVAGAASVQPGDGSSRLRLRAAAEGATAFWICRLARGVGNTVTVRVAAPALQTRHAPSSRIRATSQVRRIRARRIPASVLLSSSGAAGGDTSTGFRATQAENLRRTSWTIGSDMRRIAIAMARSGWNQFARQIRRFHIAMMVTITGTLPASVRIVSHGLRAGRRSL
jgi:hypothetical protein